MGLDVGPPWPSLGLHFLSFSFIFVHVRSFSFIVFSFFVGGSKTDFFWASISLRFLLTVLM